MKRCDMDREKNRQKVARYKQRHANRLAIEAELRRPGITHGIRPTYRAVELVDADDMPIWWGVVKADQVTGDMKAFAASVGASGAVGISKWLPSIAMSKQACAKLVTARKRQVIAWCNKEADG